MDISLFSTFIAGFSAFGAILGLTMAFYLWRQKSDHSRANHFFSVALLFFVIDVLYFGIYLSLPEVANRFPYLFGIGNINLILIIPLSYLYIRHVYENVFGRTPRLWLHFIPFIAIALVSMPIFLGSTENKLLALQHELGIANPQINEYVDYYFLITGIGILVLWVQFLCYGIAALSVQKQYLAKMKDLFSDIEAVKNQWIKGIILLWSIAFLVLTYFIVEALFIGRTDSKLSAQLLLLLECVVFLYTCLQAMQHPFLFTEQTKKNVEEIITAEKTPKYRLSALSENEQEQLYNKLVNIMETRKPYLEATLTLKNLSDMLELKRTEFLSQVLTIYAKENFYQFVNRYRIEEAKQYLQSNSHSFKSILELANAVGFNSTSVFYTRFKEITGMTPKAFQKDLDA